MIPKHIERKPGNDNYRALALYAADAKIHGETGEKTLMSWHEGCLAEDYLGGMIEIEATQAMNTRTTKEKTYHLMVSFRPEDEAKLTPENFKDIEKMLAKAIGFSDHQRHCGVHKNTDNLHMHIAFNMINPVTFNRHAPFYDHQKLHKACRELEIKYGLVVDKGIDDYKDKNTNKKHVKAETIESQTGQQSLYNFAISQKDKILDEVEKAKSWEEVHGVFLKTGLELQPRGNGLIIKDRFGKHAAKASDIDRRLSKKYLEEKFGSFIGVDKEMLSTVKAEEKYNALPLHQDAGRNNLYALFLAEIEQRKAALEAVKKREGEVFKSNKSKWDEKRKIIEKYPMLPADRKRVLLEIKAREEAELMENRIKLVEERKDIRSAIPYTSWTKFLQHHAALGNEAALEILRSKKIQPQLADSNSNDNFIKKLEATAEQKKEFSEKQIVILKNPKINQKHKRALISILKMQELISKELDTKNEDIQYKIDTKGTVIFTLKTGGTIRDTGKELHFSAHDELAKNIAEKYGKSKWGRQAVLENNRIIKETTSRGMSR